MRRAWTIPLRLPLKLRSHISQIVLISPNRLGLGLTAIHLHRIEPGSPHPLPAFKINLSSRDKYWPPLEAWAWICCVSPDSGSGRLWPPFRAWWHEADTVQERPQELVIEARETGVADVSCPWIISMRGVNTFSLLKSFPGLLILIQSLSPDLAFLSVYLVTDS